MYRLLLVLVWVLLSSSHPFPRDTTVVTESTDPVVVFTYHGQWTGITEPSTIQTPNYLGHKVEYSCDIPCIVTRDESFLTKADAVLWEVQPLTGFTDTFRRVPINLPEKLVNQEWANFGYETPSYFPLYGEPAFVQQMDFNMTYEQRGPVPVTFTCDWGGGDGLEEYKKPPTPKTKGIAAMATNCIGGGAHIRTDYLRELMKYVEVDSFGRCLHTKDWPESMNKPIYNDHGTSMRNKIEILKDYKFLLAFENNNFTDYVTEKIWCGFKGTAVPVYMGAPNIDDWIPGNLSIIRTDKFSSPKALAEYLKFLLNNQQEYDKYQYWRSQPLNPSFIEKYNRCVFYNTRCRLCKYLQEQRKKRGVPISTGKNKALRVSNSSYLTVTNSDKMKIDKTYSLAMWVKFDPIESTSYRLIDRVNSGLLNGFNFDIFRELDQRYSGGSNNNVPLHYLRLCAGSKCMLSIRTLRPYVWNHVAVTFDSTIIDGVKFYINGNFDCAYTSHRAPTVVQSRSIVIGATSEPPGTEALMGLIDDVSIWSRILNKTEIRKLLFQKLAGDEVGLELYYDFNENNSNQDTVKDISTHLRDGKSSSKFELEYSHTKPLYVIEYD